VCSSDLVLSIERRELAMETLGMNLSEGKTLLAGVQDFVIAQQVREDLKQRWVCPHCGLSYTPPKTLETRQ
jgi:transposase-like protein